MRTTQATILLFLNITCPGRSGFEISGSLASEAQWGSIVSRFMRPRSSAQTILGSRRVGIKPEVKYDQAYFFSGQKGEEEKGSLKITPDTLAANHPHYK